MAGAIEACKDAREPLHLKRRLAWSISMPKKGQHVVPSGGKWSVRTAGAKRASGTFETQKEAIDNAREKAQRQGSELYIHGRDGRIRERHAPKG